MNVRIQLRENKMYNKNPRFEKESRKEKNYIQKGEIKFFTRKNMKKKIKEINLENNTD